MGGVRQALQLADRGQRDARDAVLRRGRDGSGARPARGGDRRALGAAGDGRGRADEEPPAPIESFIALDSTPGEPNEALIGALDWGTQVGDRKYHQRTVAPGEEVYVHGTATRVGAKSFGGPDLELVDSVDDGHRDADVFLISDGTESELIDRRNDAVFYLAAGALAAIAGGSLLVSGAL